MTDNVTQILVPSPQTPMIFLPPDLAYKATISKYIVVASCAVRFLYISLSSAVCQLFYRY